MPLQFLCLDPFAAKPVILSIKIIKQNRKGCNAAKGRLNTSKSESLHCLLFAFLIQLSVSDDLIFRKKGRGKVSLAGIR